jgi:hypothetical protein
LILVVQHLNLLVQHLLLLVQDLIPLVQHLIVALHLISCWKIADLLNSWNSWIADFICVEINKIAYSWLVQDPWIHLILSWYSACSIKLSSI